MTDTTIQTRGAKIAYTERGRGAINCLFLHYWGGSSSTWKEVMAELDADARCVAVDQRGWGRSRSLNGRHDLEVMADDVEDVVAALGLTPYVLVGHSMGGKVAQIVAARGRSSPAGLVLVAPAPPQAMPVSNEQRQAMLASYQSRAGVEQALSILAGRPLDSAQRERVIADTLAGTPAAKREWTQHGMIATVDLGLRNFAGPVRIVVGELDRVERPEALRAAFAEVLPQAIIETIPEMGHLSPLEKPDAIASACRAVASALMTL
jgi:pimeloyl-ACP methyl ester carboxylesterase